MGCKGLCQYFLMAQPLRVACGRIHTAELSRDVCEHQNTPSPWIPHPPRTWLEAQLTAASDFLQRGDKQGLHDSHKK